MSDRNLSIMVGDCRETLKYLPNDTIDCVVTSPPYFGLRDYGVGGQIGREETLQEYISNLVDVFREVMRVLKATGTAWLNLGDCYSGSGKGLMGDGTHGSKVGSISRTNRGAVANTRVKVKNNLPGKNLLMVPNRVAIALQDDGWIVRSEIIWAKKGGGMPESVKDRPTCSYEKIWLLTKQPRGYFYDYEESALPAADIPVGNTNTHEKALEGDKTFDGSWKDGADAPGKHGRARHVKAEHMLKVADASGNGLTRRLRNYERPVEVDVWEIAAAKFPGSHFATFPKALVERCLAAGCPEGGIVLDPFGGAGTTGLVARLTGRSAILCELNEEYADLARRRIESGGQLDTEMRRKARRAG